jgi:P-type Cu+ transporter
MEKKSFRISGMHCAGCANSVESSLKKLSYVEDVNVNLATESATVFISNNGFRFSDIQAAVKSAGFEVVQDWTEAVFRVDGMHCAGCVNSVKKSLEQLEGVKNVEVNLATENVHLEFDRLIVTPEDLENQVESAGYKLEIKKSKKKDKLAEKREREEKKLNAARKNLIYSWIVTAPVMIWMVLDMFFGIHLTSHFIMEFVMVVAAAFVLFIPGRETLVSAWKSGKNLNPNMDVLIAIGTIASLGTGLLVMLHFSGLIEFPMHSFAGIAAMIMAFHLTGRYIETKSRGRASDAIVKLLTLEADQATIIRNGVQQEVPAKELNPGDVMLIRPGEKVPADGKVIDGEGSVNESMVTGESMPVRKEKGDQVIGGTINLEGSLRVLAEKVGEETFLNRVVQMVEEAQATRVPIQEYADRITAIFVPVVLILAFFTFVFWLLLPDLFAPFIEWADGILPWVEPGMGLWSQAFYASLAVLVIACPCALGLATPTALMIGSGLGAENGVLIRKGEAIQRMEEVTQIVFDKTGTLTTGEPVVTDIHIVGKLPENSILNLINAVENRSEHPISKAVIQYVAGQNVEMMDVTDFSSHPGLGVSGNSGGHSVVIGNSKLMHQNDIQLSEQINELKKRLEQDGKTVFVAAVDQQPEALIAVADKIKAGTKEVIQQLKEAGFQTAILTGDNETVANVIADELGIDRVYAEALPDQKSELIRKLQEKGEVVAMVGDGINDAPALTQADVGIAIGTGTDIAIESGAIVLIEGHINAVLRAVKLSKLTFKKIRQNLFWAYFYNVVMIPVAVVGLMHPVLAEAAMAFSSINVVMNSKRLQKKNIKN